MPDFKISLPSFKPEDLDDATQRRRILGYLNSLHEELRYLLMNLDEDNLGESLADSINSKADGAIVTRIEESVRNLDGSTTRMSTEIQQSQSAIALKANQSTVDALETRVDTAETKITPTAIVSTVRSSTEYQQDLDDKVDNTELTNYSTTSQTATAINAAVGEIQVGATNLFTGTRLFDGSDWLRKDQGNWYADGSYNDLTVMSRDWAWNAITQQIYVQPGYYTYSCYFKSDVASKPVRAYFCTSEDSGMAACDPEYFAGNANGDAKIGESTTSWQRLSFTVKVVRAGYAIPCIQLGETGNYKWSVCGIKFERGTKATDWSANPEELTSGTTVNITKQQFFVGTPQFEVDINGANEHFTLDANGGTMDNLAVDKYLRAPNIAEKYIGPTTVTIGSTGTYKSLREFAETINGKMLVSAITVTIQNNLYENTAITGLYGAGSLTINGGNYSVIGNGTLGSNQATLRLADNAVMITVRNLKIDGLCHVQHCTYVSFNTCTISGPGISGEYSALSVMYAATVYVYGCYFYNAKYLITVANASHFYSATMGGGNCTYFMRAAYSTIHLTTTRPNGAWLTQGGNIITPNDPSSLTVDSGSATPVPTPTVTNNMPCVASKTAYGSSASSSYIYWMSDNRIREGYTSMQGGSNETMGCMWFDTTSVSGKTIRGATLTLSRISGYGKSGEVNVHLWKTPLTNYNTQGANPNTNAVDLGIIGTIGNGETKTFGIPTSAITASAYMGLMLRSDDGSVISGRGYGPNYSHFDGYGETNPPVLTVTYEG